MKKKKQTNKKTTIKKCDFIIVSLWKKILLVCHADFHRIQVGCILKYALYELVNT